MKQCNEPIPFLSGKTTQRFEAIQNCLVPRSKSFNSQAKFRSQYLVNKLLQHQDQQSRRKLTLFMILIDVIAVLLYRHSFRRLSETKQKFVLEKFFDSSIPIFRKGFWGLNTLARLGVYGQQEIHREVGYHLRNKP